MIAPANLLKHVGCVATILIAVVSGSCHASLTTIDASSRDFDRLSLSSSIPLDDPSELPVVERPEQFDLSMSGDATGNLLISFSLVSNLNGNAVCMSKPTAQDNVYLSSWMWLPNPPSMALLKIPILYQGNRFLI